MCEQGGGLLQSSYALEISSVLGNIDGLVLTYVPVKYVRFVSLVVSMLLHYLINIIIFGTKY